MRAKNRTFGWWLLFHKINNFRQSIWWPWNGWQKVQSTKMLSFQDAQFIIKRWVTDQNQVGLVWRGWVIWKAEKLMSSRGCWPWWLFQGVLNYQEKKFLLAVERGDVASTRYILSLSSFNILAGSLLEFLQADARGAGEPDQYRLHGPSW